MKRFTSIWCAVVLVCCAGTIWAQPAALGLWEFNDASNLVKATVGNNLELVGTNTATAGVQAGDGAVVVPKGSYYICRHGSGPNGGGSYVNQFTLVIDFKIPALGSWYTFHQTNDANANDGDSFISPAGAIGVGDTGYSADGVVQANTWYRLAIVTDLIGGGVDYYLNGELIKDGGGAGKDNRFSLYTTNDSTPWVLLFADNDGDDADITVSTVIFYNSALTPQNVSALGGPLGAQASHTEDWELYQ